MSVAGTWYNVYGSQMILAQDPSTGALAGTYSSTTGSTGTYNVLGYAMSNVPTAASGEAFAVAIFWRSTTGTEDPSWHWVSGLGGQAVSDGTTNVTLNLLHCMVATDADGSIEQASYLDKLVYYSTSAEAEAAAAYAAGGSSSSSSGSNSGSGPVSSSSGVATLMLQQASVKQAAMVVDNPINGTWVCQTDSQFTLTLALTNATTGVVNGMLTYANGAYSLNGFTDSFAVSESVPLQGLSVTATVSGENVVVVLAGSLDLSKGTLTLTQFSNQATSNTETWIQTMINQFVFTRSAS